MLSRTREFRGAHDSVFALLVRPLNVPGKQNALRPVFSHNMNDWHDLTYLSKGTPRQQQVYEALTSLRLFSALAEFSPILVGTYPLNIHVAGSDLDIVCEAHDFDDFERNVNTLYGDNAEYSVSRRRIRGISAIIIRFSYEGFLIELFGQPLPSGEQYGFRHLLIEAWLLQYGGNAARQEIRQLKQAGMKTEPAFARYFQLPGDPYDTLFAMSQWSAARRKQYLKQKSASDPSL